MSEYCKKAYGVSADINRVATYRGDKGIIFKDGGSYVAVNLDKDKPGFTINIHPTDPELVYKNEFCRPRRMTRSQKRYADYLNSAHYEAGDSFATYLGIK